MPLLEQYLKNHSEELELILEIPQDEIKEALEDAYELGAISEQSRLGTTDLTDGDVNSLLRHLSGKHDQRLHGRKGTAPGPIYSKDEYHQAVMEAMETAALSEPEITNSLVAIANDVGGTPTGLDFRLKGNVARTEEKLGEAVARRAKMGMPIDDVNAIAKSDLKDLVRYTITAPDGRIADVTKNTIASLETQGYQRVGVNNYFTSPGTGGYKGVNTNFRTPSGQIFELQFHTPTTFDVKEGRGGAHRIYEVLRSPDRHDRKKQQRTVRVLRCGTV